MLSRRLLMRGFIAAPAVVAIGSLMPVRGIIMPVYGYTAGDVISGGSFTVQWYRDGISIPGATGLYYLPKDDDAERSINLILTLDNSQR